ncbi:hypothetical protein C8R43DRAFT_1139913 [Mycena crocata]|nr:hypothetical protein C8R43DRAFT_1139913 [Mycena crocata]
MSVPSTTAVQQGVRHPDFYFRDGSAVFSLKSTDGQIVLYRLQSSYLSSRSEFFASMFSLPRGPDASSQVLSEGRVDENPIQLPSVITQFDFDNLLIYLHKGQTDYPKTEEFLISVLSLSTFLEIADGRHYTINEFVKLGSAFHPALQFRLARTYRVDEWIEPAFRKLVEMPIASITMEHMVQIGSWGFFQLVQTKENVLTVRRQLAFHIPPIVNAGDCDTPAYCTVAWAREWRENVPRMIHHPEVPFDVVGLLNEIAATDIDQLCKPCQKLSVTWLWGKGWSKQEEEEIEAGIAALMSLQTGSPARARAVNESQTKLDST